MGVLVVVVVCGGGLSRARGKVVVRVLDGASRRVIDRWCGVEEVESVFVVVVLWRYRRSREGGHSGIPSFSQCMPWLSKISPALNRIGVLPETLCVQRMAGDGEDEGLVAAVGVSAIAFSGSSLMCSAARNLSTNRVLVSLRAVIASNTQGVRNDLLRCRPGVASASDAWMAAIWRTVGTRHSTLLLFAKLLTDACARSPSKVSMPWIHQESTAIRGGCAMLACPFVARHIPSCQGQEEHKKAKISNAWVIDVHAGRD
ncbi:hypothetical protein DFP72DRAFT_1081328 [Ephemerocybe angulata]|uniref:Uncharacterized protein n=1 Tax=Ephemerocybe angulata TaxID=980116 RepID=A0A8H6HBI1_9AGAR|nr:hypothetical protein DFP72DRAFT_1081328 [Tulosesus angulatus]